MSVIKPHTSNHGNGTQHPETDTVPMNLSPPEIPHQSFDQIFQEMRDRIHFQTMKEKDLRVYLPKVKPSLPWADVLWNAPTGAQFIGKFLQGGKNFVGGHSP